VWCHVEVPHVSHEIGRIEAFVGAHREALGSRRTPDTSSSRPTILPLAQFVVEGNPGLTWSAFNAIADASGTPLTIWEFKLRGDASLNAAIRAKSRAIVTP
jgi:hypothetical protein